MAQSLRNLSEEEKIKLAKDVNLVSEFKRNKFEKEAQKNWDLFYKRNTTKFFKDRHWTTREFGELVNFSDEEMVVFEVGCGVGNFMFPLMEEDQTLYFYACDFSHRAVQFVKENPSFDPARCTAFQCDIVNDDLTTKVPKGVVDVATMIFVLSAIHPDNMTAALARVYETLKPGGCLLIRDYGLYDYAMLRFAPGHKLSENFYVRQDGTRAYYFSLEVLDSLMKSSGFEVSQSEYIQRQTVNKKEGLEVPRIFVQGKYLKSLEKNTPMAGNETDRDLHVRMNCNDVREHSSVNEAVGVQHMNKIKEQTLDHETIRDLCMNCNKIKIQSAHSETMRNQCIDCTESNEHFSEKEAGRDQCMNCKESEEHFSEKEAGKDQCMNCKESEEQFSEKAAGRDQCMNCKESEEQFSEKEAGRDQCMNCKKIKEQSVHNETVRDQLTGCNDSRNSHQGMID